MGESVTGFDNGDGIALDIGIVGAGIAGLTAAAVLVRLGHNVELYERSRFSDEVGAAINVGPNALCVLKAIDFDIDRAKFLGVHQGVQFDAYTMKEKYRGTYDDFTGRFGSPWYFAHRVDLHNELRRLAMGASGRQRSAILNLSATVTEVDCESGALKLDNGNIVHKDVIIGADGIHSVVARSVLGSNIPGTEVGDCAYRFLIPTEMLRRNPVTSLWFQDSKTTMSVAIGVNRRLVWYPCRNGELINFVGIHPAKDKRVEIESWNASGSTQDLLDTFADFHPALIEMCRMAEDPKLWKLVYRPPIRQWTKGNVILIGDAAHPMLPHQGQGGSQGIEDAGALGVFLADLKALDQVPGRLEMAQNARRDRAAAMQIFSNAGQDQAARIQEDAKQYVKGPVPKNPAEFHQWNFDYNVISECRAILNNR
ncbi:hypothetical protein ACN47E_007376 [Coniothyrium glycines]